MKDGQRAEAEVAGSGKDKAVKGCYRWATDLAPKERTTLRARFCSLP
jgi:hypothetical protein